MRETIMLCGGGEDALYAAEWAEDRARAARLPGSIARDYGARVKTAYEEACHALVSAAHERPVIRVSFEPLTLIPRFDMVDAARPAGARSDRADRTLRLRALLAMRRARQAGGRRAGAG